MGKKDQINLNLTEKDNKIKTKLTSWKKKNQKPKLSAKFDITEEKKKIKLKEKDRLKIVLCHFGPNHLGKICFSYNSISSIHPIKKLL